MIEFKKELTYLSSPLTKMSLSDQEYHHRFSQLMVNAYWQGDILNLERVFDKFCMHSRPNIENYNQLLSSHGKRGNISKALETFNKMKQNGFSPDAISFNALMTAFGKVNDLEGVLDTRNQMEDAGVSHTGETYGILLRMYANLNDEKNATKIWHAMRTNPIDIEINDYHYKSYLLTLSRSGLVHRAQSIFNQINKPTNIDWSNLLNAYAIAQDADGAKLVFQDMLYAKCRPDRVIFNNLLRAYTNSGNMKEALSLMQACDRYNIVPDIYSFNAILDGWAKVNNWTQFMELFSKIVDPQENIPLPDAFTYGIAIKALSNQEKVNAEMLSKVYDGSKKDGIKLKCWGYTSLVKGWCASEKPLLALSLVKNEMKQAGFKLEDEEWSLLLTSLKKNGHIDQAESVIMEEKLSNKILKTINNSKK